MIASALKTVSLYLIALCLALAGCSAHSPTATVHGMGMAHSGVGGNCESGWILELKPSFSLYNTTTSSILISARNPEILGSTSRASGRWFRVGGEMFRVFTSASIQRLEVRCWASNHIHTSFQCSHILDSANAAAKVLKINEGIPSYFPST